MATATTRDPIQASAPNFAPGRLAMLADELFLGDDSPVTHGLSTAVMGFVRSVLRHATVEACDFFAPAATVAPSQTQVDRLTRGADGVAGRVWRLEELAPRLTASPPLAMHSPSGNYFRLHYLRSWVAPGPYPITVGHHTVSPAAWRYQMILPLLLAGYRPCDAMVCSGSSARRAVAALISQVREAMESEYGVPLPFRGRLEVIPLGVDTDVFRPRDRAAARRELGLPPDTVILLSLGRFSLHDKMDLAPLLEVFRQLRRACRQELLLVLAGADPYGYSSSVRALARGLELEQNVRILTDLPPVAPPLLYAAADLFVSVPDNVQEMFGQTPVEAMAAGLPVVVADWNGYRDTVADGVTGFRVPTLWGRCDADICAIAPLMPVAEHHGLLGQSVAVEPGELFSCLKALADSAALRQRMGGAARQRALGEFDWRVTIHRYEALWTELSEQARALPRQDGQHLGFLRADYVGAFGHFATRLLSPEISLSITPLGLQTSRGRAPLRIHPAAEAYVHAAPLRRLLSLLSVAGRLGRPVSVRAALKALRRHRLSEPEALRHLLWLVKYGLVSPGGRAHEPGSQFSRDAP